MCKKLICLISFATLLIAASNVQALTAVTTADGNGADTYLTNDTKNDGNSVYGTSASFEVRSYDGIRQRIGYIRFDLTGVTGDVNGATLSLNVTSSNRTRVWGIYGLVDETGDNWPEATTCYNNAPGMLPAAFGSYAIDPNKLRKLGVINIPANSPTYDTPCYRTSNTTSLNLDRFIGSDTNKRLTFAVMADSTDINADWWVSTKESTDPSPSMAPKLTLPNALRP